MFCPNFLDICSIFILSYYQLLRYCSIWSYNSIYGIINFSGGEKNLASREGAAEGGFKGGIPPRPSVPPERSGGGQFRSKKVRALFSISHHIELAVKNL